MKYVWERNTAHLKDITLKWIRCGERKKKKKRAQGKYALSLHLHTTRQAHRNKCYLRNGLLTCPDYVCYTHKLGLFYPTHRWGVKISVSYKHVRNNFFFQTTCKIWEKYHKALLKIHCHRAKIRVHRITSGLKNKLSLGEDYRIFTSNMNGPYPSLNPICNWSLVITAKTVASTP